MGDTKDFKEPFNALYLLAILGVLLVPTLLHVIMGWYTFVLSK